MSDKHEEVLSPERSMQLLADHAVWRLIRWESGRQQWEYYDYTGYPECRGWQKAWSLQGAIDRLAPTLEHRPSHVR